ncbi:glycosyltransferase family 4 protein [Agromyces marinus]
MTPRYPSAGPVEYHGEPRPSRAERYRDLAAGALGRPRRGTRRYYGPAAEAIRGLEPGIVIGHNAPVLPSMLDGSGHRTAIFIHNELMRTYSRFEARRVFGRADLIVCVSAWLAARTAAQLPSSIRARIRVVPNGVDTNQFRPRPMAASASSGPLRVIYVGRTIELKGPDVLLRAAAALSDLEVEYTIVGSPGFAREAALSAYERRLRELARAGRADVTFIPFVDRAGLPDLIRDADVMVVPSVRSEASGLTAGEGMASGLAIIASRVGGLPEVVGDAGILVEPNDPGALAEAIAAIATDRGRLRDLQVAARQRALVHDWDRAWSLFRRALDEL